MKKTLSLLLLSFLGLAAPAQRIEVSTGLPGLLGSLSTGNGGGVLTNMAFPRFEIITNFSSLNTSTVPIGSTTLGITLIGAGGSGGSGRRGAAGSLRTGGGGGGGGGIVWRTIKLASLWTNIIVVRLTDSGAPGSSVTADDTNGNAGTNASTECFVYIGSVATTNQIVRASCGSAGAGGNSTGAASGGVGSVPEWPGANGAASSGSGGVGGAGSSTSAGIAGGAGGGAGGGITTGDVTSAGGPGGVQWSSWDSTIRGFGGAPGVDGTNCAVIGSGSFQHFTIKAYPGAGGGGSQTNAIAGNGASGFGYGAGGGGGGASLNGYASGAGGKGGPPVCLLVWY